MLRAELQFRHHHRQLAIVVGVTARFADWLIRWMPALGLVISTIGCSTPHGCDFGYVANQIEERSGIHLRSPCVENDLICPNGASLESTLTEDEAVLIALWNNAQFQELLVELGIAHADLVQAGLLPNPEVIYFFHVADKPYKFAFEFPLEALWIRPIRIRSAQCDAERVADRLTQAGLDLIRDVRQAYADVILAKARWRVAQDGMKIRDGIAKLAESRLQAGDISAQEAATARIDSAQSKQDVARIAYDIALAEERLRNLMGTARDRHSLVLQVSQLSMAPFLDADELIEEAIVNRPDLLAAEKQLAAAEERLRISKLSWVRVLGIGDATSGRRTGHEFGPAVRMTLPIFNWNEGNIARAEAERERGERQIRTIRNQIILDIRQAHSRCQQAQAEMEILEKNVLPEVETAIRRAQAAYQEGHTSYVVVLETTRQFLDSRIRLEQLRAELRRAAADLERSVGRRLEHSPIAPK